MTNNTEDIKDSIYRLKLIDVDDKNCFNVDNDLLKKVFNILRLKDRYSADHCISVTYYAVNLGVAIGLSEEEIHLLKIASMLHDLGKVLIPLFILNKPGSLSQTEWNIMKRHSEYGEYILKQFNEEYVGKILKCHHENYDGSGYPDKLSGENIPLLSRIISVADVYDALTSDRPYRKAYSPYEAIKSMTELKCIQFDP